MKNSFLIGPDFWDNRLQAIEWLKANCSDNAYRITGPFCSHLIFDDPTDEFQFRLANDANLVFITVATTGDNNE